MRLTPLLNLHLKVSFGPLSGHKIVHHFAWLTRPMNQLSPSPWPAVYEFHHEFSNLTIWTILYMIWIIIKYDIFTFFSPTVTTMATNRIYFNSEISHSSLLLLRFNLYSRMNPIFPAQSPTISPTTLSRT